MKIKKGDRFECIQDVEMEIGVTAYTKGKIYTSDRHNAITDDEGYDNHYWNEIEAETYFKLVTPDFALLEEHLKETRSFDNYNMNLKFKKLHEKAVLPRHSKPGDAGLDLSATEIHVKERLETHYYGLAVEIPEGNVGLVFPRSSIKKYDVRLSNSVGVIDSGYRGEIMAAFDVIDDGEGYVPGDRTAQLVIVPYVSCNTEWAEELSETERGSGSYGSTGV